MWDLAQLRLKIEKELSDEPSEQQDDLTVAREFIRRCVEAIGRDPNVPTVDLLELADQVVGTIEQYKVEANAAKSPHTTEDDFQHFLSYEQLSRQPADELDRLRLAYYAGADAPRPAKSIPNELKPRWDCACNLLSCPYCGPRLSVALRSSDALRTDDDPLKPAIVQGADFVLAGAGKSEAAQDPDAKWYAEFEKVKGVHEPYCSMRMSFETRSAPAPCNCKRLSSRT